jgi:hypothetical protein
LQFPISNFPSAILFLSEIFFLSAILSPSAIPFPSKSLPHQKVKSPKAFPIKKAKSKSLKQKLSQTKGKSLESSISESFIPSGKQGGTAVLGEVHDIVTGETCLPDPLNINNLGEAAVLLARAVPISTYR